MTAYVAFQALKAGTVTPDTKLICSKEATEQAPSKLWLKVGESITLDVALKVSPSSRCVVTTNATTWLKSTSVSLLELRGRQIFLWAEEASVNRVSIRSFEHIQDSVVVIVTDGPNCDRSAILQCLIVLRIHHPSQSMM